MEFGDNILKVAFGVNYFITDYSYIMFNNN